MKSGQPAEAAKVLDRHSFKDHMFLETQSKEVRHTAADVGKAAMGAAMAANVKAGGSAPTKAPSADPNSFSQLDLSSIDLSSVKHPDNASQGAVANLPKPQGSAARGC